MPVKTDRERALSGSLRLACFAMLGYVALGLVIARAHGGNAEWFLKLGQNDPAMVQHAREVLGHADVDVPFIDHHDGQYFWLQARDPLLLRPDDAQQYYDSATYRAQRMWYPLTAAPFRLGGEQSLVWGLFLVNVGVVGLGTYFTSRLAVTLSAPLRAGLAFPLNPLTVTGVLLDLSDVWAAAALVGVVYAVRRERWGWAVAAALVAVLSREVMLFGIVAVAIGSVGRPVWARIRLAAAPAAALFLWWVYVHLRYPNAGGSVIAYDVLPFHGWLDTYLNSWSAYDRWSDFVVALLVLFVSVLVVVRFVRRRTLELWGALPFSLLVPFVSGQVLSNSTNSTRLIGPALTLLVVDAYRRRPGVPVRWPSWPARGRAHLGR